MILLLATVLLSGCASIIGSNQKLISLKTNPEDAKVLIWDESGMVVFKGNTPTQITLKSGTAYFNGYDYVVLFTKEGFPNRNVTISSTVSGWYFGNIIFGGLIGMLIIDPLTGAMWTLGPKEIIIDFTQPIKEEKTLPQK